METKIEWTARTNPDGSKTKGYTFNPWEGCSKVSPGCTNCYAETRNERYFPKDTNWGVKAPRRFRSKNYWNQPLKWNREAEASGEDVRVFCASLADVFEDRDDLIEERQRLWALIKLTPHLQWLLLTKRPQNFAMMLPWVSAAPWANVWLGVSAENQEMADERIPVLLNTPARIRFVSYEPALELVDFTPYAQSTPAIDWLIAGSESGPGARPAQMEWYRNVRDQLAGTKVNYFLKQHADNGKKISLPMIDGRTHEDVPS